MKKDINFEELREKIVKGLQLTKERVLKEKIKNDQAIAISDDGKVKVIYPGRTSSGKSE